jgi:hypothetical protein
MMNLTHPAAPETISFRCNDMNNTHNNPLGEEDDFFRWQNDSLSSFPRPLCALVPPSAPRRQLTPLEGIPARRLRSSNSNNSHSSNTSTSNAADATSPPPPPPPPPPLLKKTSSCCTKTSCEQGSCCCCSPPKFPRRQGTADSKEIAEKLASSGTLPSSNSTALPPKIPRRQGTVESNASSSHRSSRRSITSMSTPTASSTASTLTTSSSSELTDADSTAAVILALPRETLCHSTDTTTTKTTLSSVSDLLSHNSSQDASLAHLHDSFPPSKPTRKKSAEAPKRIPRKARMQQRRTLSPVHHGTATAASAAQPPQPMMRR